MIVEIKKPSLQSLYVWIVLILTFYTSGFIYNFVLWKYNVLIKTIQILISILCVPFIHSTLRWKNILYVLLPILLISLINQPNWMVLIKILSRIVAIYVFYLFCMEYEVDILKHICDFIFLLAIVYFVFWLMFDMGWLHNIGNQIAVRVDTQEGVERIWWYTNYANIYFRRQGLRTLFGLSIYASNGPFWEPGLYQIYLNFALWYYIFETKNRNWVKIILLIISIVSTGSAMGGLILICILAMYLVSTGSTMARFFKIIPTISVASVLLLYIWNEKNANSAGGVASRWNDLYDLFSRIRLYFPIGQGVGNDGAFNALLLYIADLGLLGLIYELIYIVKVLRSSRVLQANIALCIWTGLSLINEPIGYHSLFCLIVMIIMGRANHYEYSSQLDCICKSEIQAEKNAFNR